MDAQMMSFSLPGVKIKPVKPVNSEFTMVQVRAFAHGKNRNFSHVSKSELDAAIPSIAYIPVVGHLIEKYDEDGNFAGRYFGGHDVELTENWELRDLTVPFGVVTADAPFYETVVEYGKEVEYLNAYAYLWTGRYPELLDATYSDDVWFNQSVELTYKQKRPYEEDSNYTDLLGLQFSAFCILGKSDNPDEHTEPCFISSSIMPVKFDLAGAQFSQLMSEMREQLSSCFDMNATKEGGNESLNQERIDAIFAEIGIEMNAIDFEITENMTEDELRAALEAFAEGDDGAEPAVEIPVEPAVDPDEEPATDPVDETIEEHVEVPVENPAEPSDEPVVESESEFAAKFATANQKRDALRNALDPVVVRDEDGKLISEISYWVVDFDDTYVFVERNLWTADNYECKFGRFAYAFDDAMKAASITGAFEEMVQMWLTLPESAKLEAERNELEQLRAFKNNAETAAHNARIEAVKSDFEDVSHLDEFAVICENTDDVEELEMKLFALRGKQVKVKKAPKQESTVKVGLTNDTPAEAEPYGGLFAKYGFGKK